MADRSRPLTYEERVERIPARGPLRATTRPITFVAPIVPPAPGVRVFPPAVPGTHMARPDRVLVAEVGVRLEAEYRVPLAQFDEVQRRHHEQVIAGRLREWRAREEVGLAGYAPDHLPLNPGRPTLDERLRVRPFFEPTAKVEEGQFQATTIFPPDQRYIFSDTSFPWCTTGRVGTGGGWGSGTLVGPRHLLCASHMMTWNPDNTVNQVTFVPSYFDGNAPFGSSGIIHWYAYRKVVGPTLSTSDIEEDYVVLVLDQRLGDLCGWMGTRGYDQAWDGLAVWDHIGYPGDLAGGARPSFQGAIAIDVAIPIWAQADEDLWHQADVWPGQSGGPFFAWFDGEPWPRVCGVQSGQNAQINSAGAGTYISGLVNQARNDFP